MRVRKAIILAAGLNKRMLPLSRIIPKAALPVGNTPAFHLLVEECIASGIKEIIFVVSEEGSMIKKYFSKDAALERMLKKRKELKRLKEIKKILGKCRISFVVQKEPLGEAHALLQARKKIGKEACAVLYGDIVYKARTPALKQVVNIFKKKDRHVYGIVGRFVLKPEIFGLLAGVNYKRLKNTQKDKDMSLPQVFSELIDEKESVRYNIKGHRFNLGLPSTYFEAFNALFPKKLK